MSVHGGPSVHRWIVIAVVIVIVAGHSAMLRYAALRFGLGALVVAALAVVVTIKLAALAAMRARRWRRER